MAESGDSSDNGNDSPPVRNRLWPRNGFVGGGHSPPAGFISTIEHMFTYEEQQSSTGEIYHLRIHGFMLRSSSNSNLAATEKSSFLLHLMKYLKEALLPYGYPDSVSRDYAEYQAWDTAQAFFSTLTGALTTHAVMKSMGVGNAAATTLGAAITWIMRDGTGLVGRIVFGWWKGIDFDNNCKKWRLFADVMNDIAMFLELLLPYVSRSGIVLCVSTSLKALVGVAGGATRAALTQHQAIRGNMADVSAKDGSQESCVNLVASMVGILLLLLFGESIHVWTFYMIFTAGHLYTNYKAVRAVLMTTLNDDRFLLILQSYIYMARFASLDIVNKNESIIIGDSLKAIDLCGFHIKMGSSVRSSGLTQAEKLRFLIENSDGMKYMPYLNLHTKTVHVFLSPEAQPIDIIQGYYHAIILAIGMSMTRIDNLPIFAVRNDNIVQAILSNLHQELIVSQNGYENVVLRTYTKVREAVVEDFPRLVEKLHEGGWTTSNCHLSVGPWRGRWATL